MGLPRLRLLTRRARPESGGILTSARAASKVDEEIFSAAHAFAAIPARYALERRRWSEAATLTTLPSTFPWDRFPYAEAITYFARAVGAARSGNPAAARQLVEKLASIERELAEGKASYWAKQVGVQRRAAAARLAHAEGKNEEALQFRLEAPELEDATENIR